MSNIVIKKTHSEKEIKDALNVRYQVFVKEQKIDKNLEIDSWDEICDHFVAYLGNQAVGAGRIRYISLNTAKIERMAVLSDFRGKNIGGEILKTMIRCLKDDDVNEAVLNSQYHAKGFYEKFGFKMEGEIFQEADIDHVKMKKKIK